MTEVKIEMSKEYVFGVNKSYYAFLISETLNSDDFRRWCCSRRFAHTKMTGQQVYNVLMSGKESWNNQTDNEWDVTKVVFENKNNGIVGHMFIGKEGIYSNLGVIKDKYYLIRNLVHEQCHHLGFKHPYFSFLHRYSGVCYDVGEYFEQEAKKYV